MDEKQRLDAEKNRVAQQIAERKLKYSLAQQKLIQRKAEIEILGRETKKGKTEDATLQRLYEMVGGLNEELKALNKERKKINKDIANLPKAPVVKKPRGERPLNRVVMGSEFRDCNGFERRLALLMAYEIGPARYAELKRQASDDTRNHETDFYTGGVRPRWDDVCRKQDDHEDFERMMRNNRNQYAGSEP